MENDFLLLHGTGQPHLLLHSTAGSALLLHTTSPDDGTESLGIVMDNWNEMGVHTDVHMI